MFYHSFGTGKVGVNPHELFDASIIQTMLQILNCIFDRLIGGDFCLGRVLVNGHKGFAIFQKVFHILDIDAHFPWSSKYRQSSDFRQFQENLKSFVDILKVRLREFILIFPFRQCGCAREAKVFSLCMIVIVFLKLRYEVTS